MFAFNLAVGGWFAHLPDADKIQLAIAAVLLVGLVFTWREIAGVKKERTVTTYQGATDLILEIDRLFVEKVVARKYFVASEDQLAALDRDTYSELEAIGEFVLDALECIWDQRSAFSADDLTAWARYIKEMLADSALLRGIYRTRAHWYPTIDGLLSGDAKQHYGVTAGQLREWRFYHLLEPHKPPHDGECGRRVELFLQWGSVAVHPTSIPAK